MTMDDETRRCLENLEQKYIDLSSELRKSNGTIIDIAQTLNLLVQEVKFMNENLTKYSGDFEIRIRDLEDQELKCSMIYNDKINNLEEKLSSRIFVLEYDNAELTGKLKVWAVVYGSLLAIGIALLSYIIK
jgi:hypothetical protein